MVAMDCENSFVSAGKDHMVKLWTIRNQGDGSAMSDDYLILLNFKFKLHEPRH